MVDIVQAVAAKLQNSGSSVRERVIEALTEKTLIKRTQQVTDAMTEIDKLNQDFRRLKPDIVAYNEDGSVASENFSKKVLDERKKNRERVAKLTKAIDKALDTDDWSELNKASGGNKNNDSSGDADS